MSTVIQEYMPHYPMDHEFIQSLPDALRPFWDAFRAEAAHKANAAP